ncbi:efflux RND transporter periplasmic adaptor subunit [Sulfurospirillum sp. 1612]|uniref:efflux RND transporter periplasmic adaptor subunit n=1 Tax=Sulfurospirillum sp. 1612 TaxID=3094835 RepID=UPI002F951F2F
MEAKEINKNKKRNNILIFLALFFILVGLGYGVYYYLYAQFYESTDNAYAKQNIVYVTPQVSGIVDKVYVHETQYVKRGQLLASLDDRDLNLAFEQAKTNLANTVRDISKLYQQKASALSALKLAQINLEKAKTDLKRKEYLKKYHALSEEVYQDFKFAYDKAVQNLDIAKKQVAELNSILRSNTIYEDPQVKKAVVAVKQSYLNLKRSKIMAPTSGIIAQRKLSDGESVSPASTLFAIVPTKGFWVDANFKETQLHHIRIGQSAILYSDLYGASVTYHGKVAGINPGTGAVFSLLPAQNATGNWIKIVQRIPVRITLDPKELQKHPLHVGNSMQVTVDIHNQKGQIYNHQTKSVEDTTPPLYQDSIKEATAISNHIIRQNL